ncbi:MAG: thioredoxin domain-containing protein [Micrococcales bacterium]|nr:thioredoxin domain-containing protein [Micrococcales bacterium]
MNDRPTKTQRREQARRQAAELRAKQAREQRRNKIIGISLLVVAVLAVGGGIFFLVKQNIDSKKAPTALPASPPAVADVAVPAAGDADLRGIPVSKAGVGVVADGGVVVDVFLDLMCPACGGFEQIQASEIDALFDPVTGRDDVTVVYHIVSILDRHSLGTNYSARAANALSVVADKSPDHFLAFMAALFDAQPKQNTSGLGDGRIAEIAQGVGVPRAVTDEFTTVSDFKGTPKRLFIPWTAVVTNTLPLDETGQGGTPTILVNGEPWTDWSTVPMSDMVKLALGEQIDLDGGED